MADDSLPKRVVRVELTGNKHRNWRRKIRAALIRAFQRASVKLSGATVNPETKETVADEASKLTAKGLRTIESVLDKQPIENQLTLAQIEKTWEERAKTRAEERKTRAEERKTDAETRKLNADAAAQELANVEKAMELMAQFQKKTGKPLPFGIYGAPGDEIVLAPDILAQYLKKILQEDTEHSEQRNLPG